MVEELEGDLNCTSSRCDGRKDGIVDRRSSDGGLLPASDAVETDGGLMARKWI